MNTTRSHFLSGLASTLLLFACSDQDKQTDGASIVAEPAAVPASGPAFDPAQVQAQAPAAPTAVITDPNPAHGEPGHRCEIPVGASLATAPPPGAPGTTAAASPSFVTTPVEGITTSAPTSTAPGMNPPHGQPGHDCAVAVGAPLPTK